MCFYSIFKNRKVNPGGLNSYKWESHDPKHLKEEKSREIWVVKCMVSYMLKPNYKNPISPKRKEKINEQDSQYVCLQCKPEAIHSQLYFSFKQPLMGFS